MSQALHPTHPILVVDDDPGVLLAMEMMLSQAGLTHVVPCSDGRRVEDFVATTPVEVVLLDLAMPHTPGQQILERLSSAQPHVPVIVVTGSTDARTAVTCMKAGAFDYIAKPVEPGLLVATVGRAIAWSELRSENRRLKQHLLVGALEHPEVFAPIVTDHPDMLSLCRYIESVSASSRAALITGETGVGKELFARAMHAASGRKGELVVVNVAGLDDAMLSDTLFGHRRGAYTGADRGRPGLIRSAARGTLVLDEIGDLSPPSQVKLLRLVQHGEYRRLGEDKPRITDARIVAVTNRDVRSLETDSGFRGDLLYRLRGHHIHVPPLRDRLSDVPLLVEHFLAAAAEALGRAAPTASDDLMVRLQQHWYPGNVRELESMIYDAVYTCEGDTLAVDAFASVLDSAEPPTPDQAPPPVREMVFPNRLPTIKEATQQLVGEALKRAGGVQAVAARMLGISPQALSKRLKKAPRGTG